MAGGFPRLEKEFRPAALSRCYYMVFPYAKVGRAHGLIEQVVAVFQCLTKGRSSVTPERNVTFE